MSACDTKLELAAVAAALLLPIPLFVASGLQLPIPAAVERGLASLGSGGGHPSAASRSAPADEPAATSVGAAASAEAGAGSTARQRLATSSAALVVETRTVPSGSDSVPAGGSQPTGETAPPEADAPRPTPPADAPRPRPTPGDAPVGNSAGVEVTTPAQPGPVLDAAVDDDGLHVDVGGESLDVPVPDAPRPDAPDVPPPAPPPLPVPLLTLP